jgi:hypothetical protein
MFGTDTDRPTGLSREAYAIDSTFYPHQIGGPMAKVLAWHDKIGQAEVDMLVDEQRLHQWNLWDVVSLPEPHELSDEGHPIKYRRVRNDRPTPSAAEVNAVENAHHVHDEINRMYLVRFRCERLGITMECPTCKGRCVIADDDEYEAEERAADEWKRTEPPMGEGWQLWETVSEGSPDSPVFATPEELADWCAANAEPFHGMSWTRGQWLNNIVEPGEMDGASLLLVTGAGQLTTLGTQQDIDGIEQAEG